MPRQRKHVSVYNVRKAEAILDVVLQRNASKLDPPKLIDFVLATIVMAKREGVGKDALLTLVGKTWDEVEEDDG